MTKPLPQILLVAVLLIAVGCSNNLEVESILEAEEGYMNELVSLMVAASEDQICVEDDSHQNTKILALLKDNGLDCIVKQMSEKENGFHPEDSLIIISKWVTKIFRQPEYLIYDFSTSDRVLEDIDLPNAAFYRKRIKGKWYVAEQGFD